ncbi:hypothetical protein CJ195_05135 [Bacillus sp. UMB0899]|nr:hypothetical protein CJ195_05135 [Bacillus sp. UMB0899]
MVLENDYFTVMNLKKIYRIMNKFNLRSKIRRSNPYKRMAQATQEHRTCANILNRNFVIMSLVKCYLLTSRIFIKKMEHLFICHVLKTVLHAKFWPIIYRQH